MTPSTLLASIGVALMLAAFLLNIFRLMRADGYPYLSLNLIGAGLACYAASLISFIPFIVLEGTWAIAAGGALVRKAFFPPAAADRSVA